MVSRSLKVAKKKKKEKHQQQPWWRRWLRDRGKKERCKVSSKVLTGSRLPAVVLPKQRLRNFSDPIVI